jgi:predicted alpha/beta-hydrolase family hydrolase
MHSMPPLPISSANSTSPAVTDLLIDGPHDAAVTYAFAHGAGAPADSDFMTLVAQGLGHAGLRVVRFEFPYMARRRAEGTRRPPDRQPVLLETWRNVIAELGNPDRLIIGGKSMGGRMASLVADETGVAGLVAFGFPFHAPGKPPGTRIEHLSSLKTPSLFIQGTRDALGSRDDVADYDLSPAVTMHWIEDGDHNLKPRKKSGWTHDEALTASLAAAASFMKNSRP